MGIMVLGLPQTCGLALLSNRVGAQDDTLGDDGVGELQGPGRTGQHQSEQGVGHMGAGRLIVLCTPHMKPRLHKARVRIIGCTWLAHLFRAEIGDRKDLELETRRRARGLSSGFDPSSQLTASPQRRHHQRPSHRHP